MLVKFWSEVSTREKNIWAELVVTLVAATYYAQLLAGGAPRDLAAFLPELIGLIISVVIVASILFGGIALTSEAELMDERDYRIDAVANRVAYYLLSVGIIVVCFLVNSQQDPVAALFDHQSGKVSALAVVNVLIAALLLASLARAGVQMFLYRRGVGEW